MKKLLLFIALVACGKLGWDHYSAARTDRLMQRAVEASNEKLPLTVGTMRMEKIVYADRVMHISGTLLGGQEISPEFKAAAERQLRTRYCGSAMEEMRKNDVGAEYAFTRTGLRSLNDRLQAPETWSVAIRPSQCT